MSSVDAARRVFGDFRALELELDKYQRARTMKELVLPAEFLQPGEISIREMSEGEGEMMPVRIRSRRGVTREQALELLSDAREIGARYPEDPAVLAALAEAEYDAGNDAEAIAAADAAIAQDPNQFNAYVQKGYALFRRAAGAQDKAAAYREARKPFIALNRIENDHPLPLLYYYLSFARQGVEPSENAAAALERAARMAPFDFNLRQIYVRQLINDNRIDDAIKALRPIAFNPHGGRASDRARALIDKLTQGEVPGRAALADGFSGQPRQEDADEKDKGGASDDDEADEETDETEEVMSLLSALR